MLTIDSSSYFQASFNLVPDADIFYDSGYANSSISFSYIPLQTTSPYKANIYLFTPNSLIYPCVMNAMMINTNPIDYCAAQIVQDSTFSTYSCNDQCFNQTVLTLSHNFTNCVCYSCALTYDSDQVYTVQLFNNSLNTQDLMQVIIIIENLNESNLLSMQLVYRTQIYPSSAFYDITLGLIIALGIFIILLTSFLCIFNYKYKKVKDQLIAYNLVSGFDDKKKIDS